MSVVFASDWLRLAAFCAAIPALAATLRVLLRQQLRAMSRRQVFRFTGQGVALTGVIITEVTRIHKDANWHTWLDFVFALLALAGTWGLIWPFRGTNP